VKTSVVAEVYGSNGLRRGRLATDGGDEDGKTVFSRVRFVARHAEKFNTFNPQTMKIGKTKSRTAPDAIYVGNNGYPREGWDKIRVIPDSYVRDLDQIDARIAELHKERLELVAEAYRHGRKIRKEDVVVEEPAEAVEASAKIAE
jgi:hypothetical protein